MKNDRQQDLMKIPQKLCHITKETFEVQKRTFNLFKKKMLDEEFTTFNLMTKK
jgi:hypothetical protein